MRASQSYWYNLTTQSVERADERPSEDTLGPFATAEEAEESLRDFNSQLETVFKATRDTSGPSTRPTTTSLHPGCITS